MPDTRIRVIGGGLAGPEAALQLASRGHQVDLYEMRPHRSTEAHQTADFAELVCSNSLKSESENSAPWLLKQEMRAAGSFLLADADATAVPAGHALAVDRIAFSARVAHRLQSHANITIHREEVLTLGPGPSACGSEELALTILATGPLTSAPLTEALQQITGTEHLAFYDSISPIVDASTIDMDKVYFAARWDKGTADYINCPFTKEEYEAFIDALAAAETVAPKPWEGLLSFRSEAEESASIPAGKLQYFEGCLPIEETARRGRDTLRFGPMKPAGLTNPKTGRWPYAAVQLRSENLRADSYNLVGFQNHLKFGEQARILRMIPGLENAQFLRYGQIHRNTYLHSPSLLTETLQLRTRPGLLIAGQLSGVEGYTESIASGMLAGIFAAELLAGRTPQPAPRASAHGSLTHYITHADAKRFQPANITFDLLPPLEEDLRRRIRDKKERHRIQCERALEAWHTWLSAATPAPPPPRSAATTPAPPSPSPRSPAAPPPPHAPPAAPPAI